MSTVRTWSNVVTEIQRSGLNIEKQKAVEDHQRYLKMQKQLSDQINLSMSRKSQQSKNKKMQRLNAEIIDRNHYETQKNAKKQYRLKQEKFRTQNMQLIRHRSDFGNQLADYQKNLQINQNPITANLHDNSYSRKKKTKQENILCDSINEKLISARMKTQIQLKDIDYQEARKFQEHVLSKFKRLDEQRYKFKKFCLDAGNPANSSSNRLAGPDSLQRQYSGYLQRQMAQKNARNNHNIFKQDDEIFNRDLLKLNQNPQIQSSSPAYLGRIPYSYDRQKQLFCLNKQFNKHTRTRTEASQISQPTINITKQKPQQQKIYRNLNNSQIISQKNEKIKEEIFNTNESPKKQQKSFRQYNIITGNMFNIKIPDKYP